MSEVGLGGGWVELRGERKLDVWIRGLWEGSEKDGGPALWLDVGAGIKVGILDV